MPGEYRVAVHEGTSRIVSIASDTVVNFDLPLVQIGGRIVEDGGTVPIAGAGVHVIGIEPQTDVVRSYKETDDLGEFHLIGIVPGEVLLTVYKPGYEMQREKISYSSPITNKKIALRRSAGVEVRVQSASDDTQIRQLVVSERMPGQRLRNRPFDSSGSRRDWLPAKRAGRQQADDPAVRFPTCRDREVERAVAGFGVVNPMARSSGSRAGSPSLSTWDGQSFELP